jgi:hypothetical protein
MGSYTAALSVPGTDITQTYAYRRNCGFGLNKVLKTDYDSPVWKNIHLAAD